MTPVMTPLATGHQTELARLLCNPKVSRPLFGGDEHIDPDWVERFIDERMQLAVADRSWTFVMHVDHDLAGMASLLECPQERSLELGICVVPSHQRQGIARAAIAALVQFAAERDFRHLCARCGRSNDKAVLLMRRCGFREGPEDPAVMRTWRDFELTLTGLTRQG